MRVHYPYNFDIALGRVDIFYYSGQKALIVCEQREHTSMYAALRFSTINAFWRSLANMSTRPRKYLMLNIVWLSLIIGSIIIGIINGTTGAVVSAVTNSAQQAVIMAIGLVGVMSLWLGIMRIAEDAGLIKFIGRLLNPIMKMLFPSVPSDHPAIGAITLNIAANMLGIGNAATPFGLRAMEQLAKLNPYPKVATNAMCMFLAINTSSVQLIPTTAIAILAANGATNPTNIIFPALIATTCSTIAAIFAVKIFERAPLFSYREKSNHELTTPE